jgi:metal-dependent amidase/aminoacylase/carboxypeptidase family protein
MTGVDEILAGRLRGDVIPGYAVLELNMRSYSAVTRQRMLDAIGRIVRAECQASGSPKDPEFSEDFSKIPDAAHVPYCYWDRSETRCTASGTR